MNLETKIGTTTLSDYAEDLPLLCVKENKTPEGTGWSHSWKWAVAEGFPEEGEVESAWGIGLQCGILRKYVREDDEWAEADRENGFEAIDFDSDADLYFPLFIKKVEAEQPTLLKKIYCEKSPHGFHILYRVSRWVEIGGGQKLARRPAIPGKKTKHGELEKTVQVLIETRGANNYIIIAPTPGYEPLEGYQPDLLSLPEITAEERNFLLETARGFDQLPKKEPRQWDARVKESAEPMRIVNIFRWGRVGATLDMWKCVLEADGWRYVRTDGSRFYFQRPGKVGEPDAVSANLARVDGAWFFYNFSTAVDWLENDRAYSYVGYLKAKEGAEAGAVDYAELAKRLWEERWKSCGGTVKAIIAGLHIR